nr:MAG TPA: ferredoxin I [Bacteriophage sp.]
MDEDEKLETEADDLTPDEQEIEDETDTSGEEAHRIGEFDDLRDRLERIETVLGNITSTLEAMRTTAAAIGIDNGADVADVDDDGDADVVTDDDDEADIIPDYDDMDLDL